MKLAGLKSLESAHDDSIWTATWVPATESRPHPFLLTGSLDESVRLWSTGGATADNLVLERTNTGHSLGVVSVAAHPSGVIAASAALDSFVRVFDVDTNNTIASLESPPSESWQLQFHPKCCPDDCSGLLCLLGSVLPLNVVSQFWRRWTDKSNEESERRRLKQGKKKKGKREEQSWPVDRRSREEEEVKKKMKQRVNKGRKQRRREAYLVDEGGIKQESMEAMEAVGKLSRVPNFFFGGVEEGRW
ncbi:hypothetical protein Cgig2_009721 [Carnegiea gigantea]|uniref:Uncharacterized protein n=1 Tax=Carnegiea gigantea TaxID=171969 RepID=A0A9Q1K4Z3_9CARY|nr:hypothetical protein Cgig2_009721 [Carnegiea gigantea]